MPTRRLAALFFSDIVGFTRLSSEDESAALRLLEGNRDEARRQLEIAVERGWRGGWRGVPGFSLDPVFRSLRGEPRFDRLVAEAKADLDRQRARVAREGW